jgi:transposase-like protein
METTLENVRLLRRGQILKEWRPEVNDDFWSAEAQQEVKKLMKSFLEDTLEQDLELQRERATGSLYRNGYYPRSLHTQFGLMQDLQVPRLRDATFKTRVFERYQRFQPQVENLIRDTFLRGVSTRKIGGLFETLLDTKVSATKVSNVCKKLNAQVRKYHQRPLLDEYQYLILDGISLKIRIQGKYVHRRFLVAYGITMFGKRELIDFKPARGESKEAWESFLQNLFLRGFEGKHLKLIAIDGSAGLKTACELIYPQARIQRCWAHKLRNVSNYCKAKYEKACIADARKIYLAQNKNGALKQFKEWKAAWKKTCSDAVHCLEKDLEDLLPFLDCPKTHQIKVRTTNVIERAFREVRRRTKVFSCFTNLESTERIIFAIFSYLNDAWKVKPLKQFTQFI